MRVLLAFALVAVAMGSLRGAASGDDAVSTAPVAMKVDKAQDPFLTRVKSIPTLAKKLDGLEDALADQVRGIAVRNGDSPPPPPHHLDGGVRRACSSAAAPPVASFTEGYSIAASGARPHCRVRCCRHRLRHGTHALQPQQRSNILTYRVR